MGSPAPAPVHVWMLCGYAGSGKTHAANVMCSVLRNCMKTAFADAVKDDVATIYNLPRAMFDTQEGKATEVATPDGMHTARGLLIDYSLAMKEAHGEDVWAKEVVRRIMERDTAVEHIVIHDWRYIVEYETMRDHLQPPQFVLHTIRIGRPSVHAMDIPSERNLDGYPAGICISNTGSVVCFEAVVKEIIANYCKE